LKRVDEGQIYSLISVAQTLMGQSGVINELRLRLTDPLGAQKVATQVEAQSGYKSVSWQEANSDLLSTFATRDFIVLTVMGAMLPRSCSDSPMHYLASGANSMVCCAVAAFFPARKATRVHPVESIRGAS